MTQPLVGKQILIVEDEPVFRSLLDSWFSSLGATTALAAVGFFGVVVFVVWGVVGCVCGWGGGGDNSTGGRWHRSTGPFS